MTVIGIGYCLKCIVFIRIILYNVVIPIGKYILKLKLNLGKMVALLSRYDFSAIVNCAKIQVNTKSHM